MRADLTVQERKGGSFSESGAERVRIALIGPFGYGNLGDAATQDAMILNIRKRLRTAEIIGVSLNPDDTSRRHGILSIPLGRMPGEGWSRTQDEIRFEKGLKRIAWVLRHFVTRFVLEFRILARIWNNLKGLDALIVSGGGQLDDYWGGPFSHPFTLLKWSIASRLRGAYLFFVSVGAGPIQSKLSFVFIKRALLLGHYRTFRDEGSKALLGTLGFRSDDLVFPDLAHSIDIDVLRTEKQPLPAKRTVGIGPMSYFKQYFWPEYDDEIYDRYLGSLARFLARVHASGYALRFFPGEAGADTRAIQDLTTLLTEEYGISPDALIHNGVETVEDLLQEISSTDIIVASRFHGVLLAHVLGKPVVALSYHPKIDHIMKNVGHERYCLDISSFTSESLQSAFADLEQNYAEAQRQVLLVESSYREQLDHQYDRIVEMIGR